MGVVLIKGGGGSSADLDVITATAADILAGKVGLDKEGNPITGTMKNCGQTQTAGGWGSGGTGADAYFAMNRIPEGAYFSNGAEWAPEIRMKQSDVRAAIGYTDPSKVWNGYTIAGLKGTMSVSSVVSFSLASVSGLSVTLKWKNPSKGPYGGVIIRYKTGSYPSSVSDGTQFYKGTGSNSALNGDSSYTGKVSAANATYYFRIWMYCDTSNGTMYSGSKDLKVTVPKITGNQTFTGSGTFTVPEGVTKIKVFVVGGGASGGSDRPMTSSSSATRGGGGGGGGYTKTAEYTVSSGQKCTVTIGAGGAGKSGDHNAGGATSFRLPNGTTLSAAGGKSTRTTSTQTDYTSESVGTDGGSGGGDGGDFSSGDDLNGKAGGSNGGNGGLNNDSVPNSGKDHPSKGQGTTTRAYGESSGTLYSGGGGGSAGYMSSGGHGSDASGGSGGGGFGKLGDAAGNGTANSGGGGGGHSYWSTSGGTQSGAGGSGICLIKWGY